MSPAGDRLDGDQRRKARSDVRRRAPAGVSHQTVSRVINGSTHVREERASACWTPWRKLDYRPNSVARALVTGRSQTLGVVTLQHDALRPGVDAARDRARGPRARATSSASPAWSRWTARRCCRRSSGCARWASTGILIDRAAGGIARRGCWDLPPTCRSWPWRPGRRTACRSPRSTSTRARGWPPSTCSSSGTTTVQHIAGPAGLVWRPRPRIEGWRDALDAAGASARRRCAATGARARATSSAAAARPPDVTAIFVANDQMALGLLRALHELGRDVPGDVSVVGFDDIPEAAFFTPAADHRPPALRRDGPPQRCTCCSTRSTAGERSPGRASDVPRPRASIERASTAPPRA